MRAVVIACEADVMARAHAVAMAAAVGMVMVQSAQGSVVPCGQTRLHPGDAVGRCVADEDDFVVDLEVHYIK